MINVVIDNIIYYLQGTAGISVYFNEITKRFLADERFCVKLIDRPEKSNVLRDELKTENIELLTKPVLKLARYLPVKQKSDSRYYFISSYYRFTNDKNATNVTVVHDFTYEKKVKGVKRFVHHWQKKQAIKKSDIIICISHNTKKDLLYYFPWAAEKKIFVIHNGVGDVYRPLENDCFLTLPANFPKKYLLFVGGRGGYKNFDKCVQALSYFSDDYGLLVVGGDWNDSEKELIKAYGHRIHLVKYPDKEQLNRIYNSAFCLLYPSSYEGFGIPVVEAMRAGCPVVALNMSSIPEIAGDAAILSDKSNGLSLYKSVKILEDDYLRQSYIDKGKQRSKLFSWNICYQQFAEILTDNLL